MAFRRALKPTFKTTVTVNTPNDKGGFDKNTFDAIYERPDVEACKKLQALDTTVELVRRVCVGWEMQDADTNEAVPFTTDTLETVMQIPGVANAMALAFWESLNGARSKN